MRRTTKKVLQGVTVSCFLFLVACGQKTEQETAITNTVTPTVTLAPTATPIPEPTATPSPTAMIDIPLSEEYFPDLYEIQLVGMNMSGDVVVTNPLLGVFKLTYEGDAITIDLTACEKLHTCVVHRSSEIKPTILLPKHLEVTPLERISPYGNTYYDCVIGETARQWHSGEW